MKKGSRKGETWAGAFKAVGLRSISFGKFWQFCFMVITVALIFKIRPEDWPTLFKSFAESYWVGMLGWIAFIVVTSASVMLIRFMRMRYLEEIERLVTERNQLQERLLGGNVAPSNFIANK